MTAQEIEASAEPHWLHTLRPWPRVPFPWAELPPHQHDFGDVAEAGPYNARGCRSCGLRLVQLWLDSATWIRRRTEAVTFIDDRTVHRRVTLDFVMPGYAPCLNVAGRPLDVVPVALLQKKSLINFDLRDASGSALSLLSLRQQQMLTASALKGLAAAVDGGDPRGELDPLVEKLVECLVYGDRPKVRQAMTSLRTESQFAALRKDWLFLMTCERLQDNWLMCLLLQRDPETVRRILKFSYQEPLDLRFQAGTRGIQEVSGEPPADAGASSDDGVPPVFTLAEASRPTVLTRVRAGLGLAPMLIRFPIHSAESAQSYHLQVDAPPGALVRAAAALAVRPESPDDAAAGNNVPGPVYDKVHGSFPTVDLHLADVPTGAFVQAQVELRAQMGGWLASTTVACWVNSLLLLALVLASPGAKGSATDSVALLIVFVSFGSAVIAQQESHAMLGKLLRHAKALAGLSTLSALAAATLVALTPDPGALLVVPLFISSLCALLLSGATFRTRAVGTASSPSPWDFTPLSEPGHCPNRPDGRPAHDAEARIQLGFDRPAIAVATSESVRHRTRWSARVDQTLKGRLKEVLRELDGVRTVGGTVRQHVPTQCRCPRF